MTSFTDINCPAIVKMMTLNLIDDGIVHEDPALVVSGVETLMGIDTGCGRMMTLINRLSIIGEGATSDDYDVAYAALMSYRLGREVPVN
jgi:hypothetical protein